MRQAFAARFRAAAERGRGADDLITARQTGRLLLVATHYVVVQPVVKTREGGHVLKRLASNHAAQPRSPAARWRLPCGTYRRPVVATARRSTSALTDCAARGPLDCGAGNQRRRS